MFEQGLAAWAGAAGVAVAVVGGAAVYWAHPAFLWPSPPPGVVAANAPESPPPLPAQPAVPIVKSEAAAAKPKGVKPAFDVVNVEPTGETVVAGRAAPNAKVELRDAGKTLAEATTDNSGQFVMIPPPLAPGDHSLSLATGTGASEAATSGAIAVDVPAPPAAPASASMPPVATPPPAAAPKMPAATPAPVVPAAKPDATLATASPAASPPPPAPALKEKPAATPTPEASARIAIRSVEASGDGRMAANGAAEPNAVVRLYLNGAYVADAKTKSDGRWSLTIEHGMSPGGYSLRADEIDPSDAKVLARAEAPFNYTAAAAPATASAPPSPSPPASAASAVATAAPAAEASSSPQSSADAVVASVQIHHVLPGHTLWGISQKFYGDGTRYTLIFAANANQIRDPHWIYPGQIFVVPKPEPRL